MTPLTICLPKFCAAFVRDAKRGGTNVALNARPGRIANWLRVGYFRPEPVS